MALTRLEADQVVRLAQEGHSHPLLEEALKMLGLTREAFDKCRQAMREVTRGRSRLHILTPAGHGRRS